MSFYTFFEKLVDPLPDAPVTRPPQRPLPFIWYYVKPIQKLVFITLICSGVAAMCEISLFVFIGYLVDWMRTTEPSVFFDTHKWAIVAMSLIAFVLRPIALITTRCLLNFTLSPGLVAATRWQNHRYVLRQSMTFFQNDFAGRVAQKVMQTGNSVREVVINVVDGVWLLIIYVVGISFLLNDIQAILLIPMLIWLISYACVVAFMVPPVRDKSARVSEATSAVTGRVVDSYTNIQSVKLFAHNELEERFAADAIARHVRAFVTLMGAIMNMTIIMSIMNTALMFSTAALSVWL